MGSTSYFGDWYVVVPIAIAFLLAVIAWGAIELVLRSVYKWRHRTPDVEHLDDLRVAASVDAVETDLETLGVERTAFESLDHLRSIVRVDHPEKSPIGPLTMERQAELVSDRLRRHYENTQVVADLHKVASVELDMVCYELGQILSDVSPFVDVSAWRDGDEAQNTSAADELAEVA